MIPLFAILEVHGRRPVTLWLPLFLLWLLLLPIVLVLLPLELFVLLFARIDGWRALPALWNVLAGLRGTHVEISTPQRQIFIHVH